MGVKLTVLVQGEPIEMEHLNSRKIGIDAYNWMFQFLSAIRDRFTGEPLKDSKGNVTSHLSGLFYRTSRLLEHGAIPVYVFDGKPPEFKKKTTEAREKVREEARKKWVEAVEKGEEAYKYAQGASRVTKDLVEESKELLKAMGVSCVQSPSEGEAQISHLCKQGKLWAGASQDYDSLLFGMPRLVRNLNIIGKKKLSGRQKYVDVKPNLIELNKVLSAMKINQDQLILLSILVGTDYAPGIKGIGPKTSLKLVREHKTLENVVKNVNWENEVSIEKIFNFFKNPPIEDLEIKEEEMNIENIRKILIDDHDFTENRINPVLEKLSSKKKQTGLGNFLK